MSIVVRFEVARIVRLLAEASFIETGASVAARIETTPVSNELAVTTSGATADGRVEGVMSASDSGG